MQEQITKLSIQVSNLATTQELNHAQNRKDIHDLRNGQQSFRDALAVGFKEIADSMKEALKPIRQDVLSLQMWKERITGYYLAISAVSAVLSAIVFELVRYGLSKAGLR